MMDGWMNGWMDGWVDGWIRGKMDYRMKGGRNGRTILINVV